MKKIAVVVIAIMLSAALSEGVSAQMNSKKGPSAVAYEKASEDSILNRAGDWFATRGKSGMERDAIIAQRKAKRSAEKAQKEAARKAKQLEKQANKAGKDMAKSMNLPKK